MTFDKPLIFKVLLTTCACFSLSACGGGERSGAGHNDSSYKNAPAPAKNGSTEMRLAKLEGDVEILKRDFSQLAMTYNGLMTTNDRIDELLTRLEQEKRATPVPAVEKAPAPEKKPATAAKTSSLPSAPTVVGVRLGEHGDKTRLVIDSSTATSFQTDLDNNEKILLVTLSKLDWTAKETVSGLSSPLVAGWSVQDNGGVKVLAVQLKKPVKILNSSKIAPEKGVPAKVVIDLGAAS